MTNFRIAVIGIGNMGSRVAKRLLAAGNQVSVFDTNPTASKALVEGGAVAAQSVVEAVSTADFIFTSLPHPSILEMVSGDIITAAPNGATVLDLSTVDPETTRQVASSLREANIDFLDVPVSGGVTGAENGTLVVMAGGKSETLNHARPVLDVIAAKVVHCGDIGTGQLTKLSHNLLTAINTVALGEVLTASVAAGANLATLQEVFSIGLAGSKMLDYLPQTLLTKDRPANFALDLMNKDIGLALKEFERKPMYLGQVTKQLYNTAAVQGLGHEDSTSVASVYEKLNSVRLCTE